MEDLAIQLFKINAVKFGDFRTKVGMLTPVYFDLRVIISYPNLLEKLADLMIDKIKSIDQKLICGVPYTALPIATLISYKTKLPMVMRRKETKDYGTKKLIEGVYKTGDTCLIVEDVVTSGSSILETVKDLQNSNIVCNDAVVLLNREQGGEAFLSENGIKMHSLVTMSELMDILLKHDLITEEVKSKVDNYVSENKVKVEVLSNVCPTEDRLKLSYMDRCKLAKNEVAKNLFTIMASKKSNLCVAADFIHAVDILNFAENVGPYICCLKLHVDIIEDFHMNFVKRLTEISETYNFIIMEDRKFADIGKTVQLQFTKGSFHINSWAHCVTAHSLFGKSVLEAIHQADNTKKCGVFLLAEASSSGCLISENYTTETVKLATEFEDLITGIVCQSPLFRNRPGFIQLTPGVQLGETKDDLGQQYCNPENIIIEKGGDIAVVGRGITQSLKTREIAKLYQEKLWEAYSKRTIC